MSKETAVLALCYGLLGLALYIVGSVFMWSEVRYPSFNWLCTLERRKRYQLFAWLMLTPLPTLVLPILFVVGWIYGAYANLKEVFVDLKIFVDCLRGKYER